MLSEPEHYGLTGERTLAHVSTTKPPENFELFWTEFCEAVQSCPRHWQGNIGNPVNEVIIPSLRDIRVVARVSRPETTPAGIVVTTHGYEADDHFSDDPEPWTRERLVTVRLRIRGYPPSTLDQDDVRDDWILHGFEAAEAWILRGAVADVLQACRCARSVFGDELPLALHGESFGGGLAVLAAAQLYRLGTPPHRLALGLPTFGDWAWREHRYCNGAGGQLNVVLDAARGEHRDRLRHTLALFDTALHAASITCPTVCKLAHRDDTVPAPAAASVFNAIASDRKWRFETAYGHYDGGLADLRRHVQFEHLQTAFLHPGPEPEAIIASLDAPFSL